MLPRRRGGAGKKLALAARLWARGEFNQGEDHDTQADHLDEQFAFFGLVPDRPALEPVKVFHLWPENVPVWALWNACAKQWDEGMDGRIRLNLPGVEIVMQRTHVPRRKRDRFWSLLQVMETVALEEWRKLREERRRNEGR